MKSGTRTFAGIAVSVGVLVVAPTSARAEAESQRGCREAGQFIASTARELGPGFGEFSSELAELGLRDDFAHGLQSTLCEPPALT